jgi:hypothetical protein
MKIDSKRQNKSQWKEAINSSLGNIPLLPFYVRRQSLFSDSRYVIADLSKLWLSCSCPLAFLFMPFDFPVHALWLSCSCPLAFLFMPFGFPVHALCLTGSQMVFESIYISNIFTFSVSDYLLFQKRVVCTK